MEYLGPSKGVRSVMERPEPRRVGGWVDRGRLEKSHAKQRETARAPGAEAQAAAKRHMAAERRAGGRKREAFLSASHRSSALEGIRAEFQRAQTRVGRAAKQSVVRCGQLKRQAVLSLRNTGETSPPFLQIFL